MRADSLFHGNRSEKTFALALSLLGAIAAVQIICALLIYLQRAREARRTAEPAAVELATVAVSPSVVPRSPSVAPMPARTTKAKTPQSAPGAVRQVSVPDELLQVAKALRLQGDTGNAIAKLQQAAALAPQNPEILAELAMTYESMQLFERSNETWRKLQSLGAGAGPLSELAQLKLRVGVQVPGLPGSTGSSPAEEAAPNDTAGIPDGSAFGISQATQTTVPDPDAQTKVTLRVGVKLRGSTPIDSTKVKIQVFFYDVVNNEQVLLTDADVSYEWITPNHNWAETDTEVLDVTYLRPKKSYPAPGAGLAAVPDSVEKATREKKGKGGTEEETGEEGPRQYLGYIVRVYYQDQLQAVRAEPTRLLNLYPPPFTAPPS